MTERRDKPGLPQYLGSFAPHVSKHSRGAEPRHPPVQASSSDTKDS